jgi:hypothetical protein
MSATIAATTNYSPSHSPSVDGSGAIDLADLKKAMPDSPLSERIRKDSTGLADTTRTLLPALVHVRSLTVT